MNDSNFFFQAREEEEHKQSVSTSMINQHANAPHPTTVNTPLVVVPHSSSSSRGHPQQQHHAHPTHNVDADHQRRVSSHGVRPSSQPHGASVPAKLPQGPSSIFDAVVARPSSHGEINNILVRVFEISRHTLSLCIYCFHSFWFVNEENDCQIRNRFD